MLSRFVHIWFCDSLQCRCQIIIIMVWFQFDFHFVPKIKTKNQTSYQPTYQSQVNKKCRKISNGTQQDVPAVAAAFLSMSSLCSSPTLSQFSRSYICSTALCFRASQFSSAHFSSAQLLIASLSEPLPAVQCCCSCCCICWGKMTPLCIDIITEIIFFQLAPTSWWTWCRRSSRRSALREILHCGRVRGIQGFC